MSRKRNIGTVFICPQNVAKEFDYACSILVPRMCEVLGLTVIYDSVYAIFSYDPSEPQNIHHNVLQIIIHRLTIGSEQELVDIPSGSGVHYLLGTFEQEDPPVHVSVMGPGGALVSVPHLSGREHKETYGVFVYG